MDGPNQGQNLYKSIRWTDPTKGQGQSTKWTDPTRVKLIQNLQSGQTPTRVKTYPQSGRAQLGPTYINPQSGRTPPRVKTSPQNGQTQLGSNSYKIHKVDRLQLGSRLIHKADGPNQGSRPVHKMDRPNQSQTYTSTKKTDSN